MYKYIYELKESKLNPIKIEFEKKEDFLKKSKIINIYKKSPTSPKLTITSKYPLCGSFGINSPRPMSLKALIAF